MFAHGNTSVSVVRRRHTRNKQCRGFPHQARLRLHLRNIDKLTYCQSDTPVVAELRLTAFITIDEIPDTFSPTPGLSPDLSQSSLSDTSYQESTIANSELAASLQEKTEWSESDFPHSWIDIASFDSPATLEPYVIQIDQFYASTFPGCRHLQFFESKKEVMYHIVQDHIDHTEKQFVCVNCGAEFDDSDEADQHLRIMQNSEHGNGYSQTYTNKSPHETSESC